MPSTREGEAKLPFLTPLINKCKTVYLSKVISGLIVGLLVFQLTNFVKNKGVDNLRTDVQDQIGSKSIDARLWSDRDEEVASWHDIAQGQFQQIPSKQNYNCNKILS